MLISTTDCRFFGWVWFCIQTLTQKLGESPSIKEIGLPLPLLLSLIGMADTSYLLVLLSKKKVLLVNIYAPNFDNAEFANRLLSYILHLSTHLLILGGDLNCVIDPSLDMSSNTNLTRSAMSNKFFYFMKQN